MLRAHVRFGIAFTFGVLAMAPPVATSMSRPGSLPGVIGGNAGSGMSSGLLAVTFTPALYWFILAGLATLAGGLIALHILYSRRQLKAVTAERTRIARELHDTLAQGLAGVGIQIDTALRKIEQEPRHAGSHLELARSMVRASMAEVRRSIWVLRTQTSTRRGGLRTALADSLSELTGSTGIDAQMTVTGKARALAPEVERGLLRIAHEAVTNAVRHAAARTIRVVLSFDRDALRLNVRDDGRGFDVAAPLDHSRGDHFGLVGISERAQAMGGELRLESRPGQGTEIVCRLPYHCQSVDPLDPSDHDGDEKEGASL